MNPTRLPVIISTEPVEIAVGAHVTVQPAILMEERGGQIDGWIDEDTVGKVVVIDGDLDQLPEVYVRFTSGGDRATILFSPCELITVGQGAT